MTRFNFDDMFERKEDGKLTCKIDPYTIENEKYEFTVHKVIEDISNQHRKILDDWCKAYLAKEYEIGNDIHPGCFTIEQREVMTPGQFGYEYMISPNDQNLGVRVKWVRCENSLPCEDEIVLCYCPGVENFVRGASWMGSDFCLGRHRGGSWKRVDNENIGVESWMKFPIPEKKIPEWKELGMCCHKFWDCVRWEEGKKYYIEDIPHDISFCPWCGENVKDMKYGNR